MAQSMWAEAQNGDNGEIKINGIVKLGAQNELKLIFEHV